LDTDFSLIPTFEVNAAMPEKNESEVLTSQIQIKRRERIKARFFVQVDAAFLTIRET
jgi:hypothetical protein